MVMIGGIDSIMHEWAFHRELCGFLNDQQGGAGFPPAHMEMRHVHLMTSGKLLEDIVVP
jgi:hypothetical protein